MTPARIFIDFWNLQLNVNKYSPPEYKLDWLKLSPCLLHATEHVLGTPLSFEGTNVYLSYNPKTPQGNRLRHWSSNVLDRFPGINVTAKERKPKSPPPTCPQCHQKVTTCPHCGAMMAGTIEKGIDTSIVTDMLQLAWEDAWDVAILVSSDRDFIPLVNFLRTKGRKVINVYFPPSGSHLAKTCWASIDLRPHLLTLAR